MALIQLYQFLLSIKLSFRVMSLSAAVGIRDLGEGSIGNPSVIILTPNLLDLLFSAVETDVFVLTFIFPAHLQKYDPPLSVGLQHGASGGGKPTQLLRHFLFRQ